MGLGPYAGADYNLSLCPLDSLLQLIYHGQPYARVDLNPPVRDLGFGLSSAGVKLYRTPPAKVVVSTGENNTRRQRSVQTKETV